MEFARFPPPPWADSLTQLQPCSASSERLPLKGRLLFGWSSWLKARQLWMRIHFHTPAANSTSVPCSSVSSTTEYAVVRRVKSPAHFNEELPRGCTPPPELSVRSMGFARSSSLEGFSRTSCCWTTLSRFLKKIS